MAVVLRHRREAEIIIEVTRCGRVGRFVVGRPDRTQRSRFGAGEFGDCATGRFQRKTRVPQLGPAARHECGAAMQPGHRLVRRDHQAVGQLDRRFGRQGLADARRSSDLRSACAQRNRRDGIDLKLQLRPVEQTFNGEPNLHAIRNNKNKPTWMRKLRRGTSVLRHAAWRRDRVIPNPGIRRVILAFGRDLRRFKERGFGNRLRRKRERQQRRPGRIVYDENGVLRIAFVEPKVLPLDREVEQIIRPDDRNGHGSGPV